jgi:predicted HicB family RNase H-like nuclease
VALLHVRAIPDRLHRACRISAIEAGQSLRQFVIDALRHELERRGVEVPDDKDQESSN